MIFNFHLYILRKIIQITKNTTFYTYKNFQQKLQIHHFDHFGK